MPTFRPFLLMLPITACAWQGPSLAGQEGLPWEVQSFYGARAMEANARCPNPRMTGITRSTVVEDTPERMVMDIRYYWVDDGQTVDSGGGGGKIICQDWGERRFTFARTTSGTLEVVGMTGPQKRR